MRSQGVRSRDLWARSLVGQAKGPGKGFTQEVQAKGIGPTVQCGLPKSVFLKAAIGAV